MPCKVVVGDWWAATHRVGLGSLGVVRLLLGRRGAERREQSYLGSITIHTPSIEHVRHDCAPIASSYSTGENDKLFHMGTSAASPTSTTSCGR